MHGFRLHMVIICLLGLYPLAAQARMSSVKAFGAQGNGIDDDTEAFIKAIRTVASAHARDTIYVPSGTYLLSRSLDNLNKPYALCLPSNTSIIGEGAANTILKINPAKTTAVTRLLWIQDVSNVVISDLTIDGSSNAIDLKRGIPTQMHGIFIQSSMGVTIKGCKIMNTLGDGVGINGPESPSVNITIVSCCFERNGRNGITLGSGFDGINLIGNEFSNINVQPIDSEPQRGITRNVNVTENTINGLLDRKNLITISGNKSNVVSNYTVKRNKLFNCGIQCINAVDVLIDSNEIRLDASYFASKAAVYILGNNRDVTVSNNRIETNDVPFICVLGTAKHGFPDSILFQNNRMLSKNAAFIPVVLQDGSSITMRDNQFDIPASASAVVSLKSVNIRNSLQAEHNASPKAKFKVQSNSGNKNLDRIILRDNH